MRKAYAFGAAAALLAVASPYMGIPGWTPSLATIATLTAISVIGLNLIFGYCGMLALGQAAFAALASYTAGILQVRGVPMLAGVAIGLLAALTAARLVAEIFIRLPGIYLAVGTLGFAYVVEGLARAFPKVTGGPSGLILPPFPLSEAGWYVLAVLVLAVALASAAYLVSGRSGRTLRMIQRDELAAAVAGIDIVREKIRIFTIGSGFSALGGLMLSFYSNVITPEMGGANASLEQLAVVIIGGAGSVTGPIWGAVLINWLFAMSGAAAEYELLVYGLCFLLVILFAPSGIAGIVRKLFVRYMVPAAIVSSDRLKPWMPPQRPDERRSETAGLRVSHISKRFGGLQAVRDVTFEVRSGEIVALIGPNGAGKSTLFNILSGLEWPDEGEIALDGMFLSRLKIHQRAMMIGRSFQVPRMIGEMTVVQNVAVRIDQLRSDLAEHSRIAISMRQLERFGLSHLATDRVNEVAVGLHKVIDVARAALGSPSLVLLDEPAVGLSGEELDRLRGIMRSLRDAGAAIVVVDHNLDFVLSIADRIVALDGGATIAIGPAAEVIADARVRSAYMGILT
jgi:ABC-type branched-subunit amino acid transport system ATPase component/ABC-type branched-subunit amino acid transport system permease subunit